MEIMIEKRRLEEKREKIEKERGKSKMATAQCSEHDSNESTTDNTAALL